MRIVWIGLLLLACGQPQAGQVYSDTSQAMVLGLMQNDGGAYELQLCKDGATGARKRQKAFTSEASECANPLVTADGEAYSFNIRGKSWLAQSLRWGAALLTLNELHDADLKREAGLIQAWDEHLGKLRSAVLQSKTFELETEFATAFDDLRTTLKSLPQQGGAVVELDEIAEALKHNKISRSRVQRKLAKMDRRVQRQFSKVFAKDWNKAMQKARRGLERSDDFHGRRQVQQGLKRMRVPVTRMGEGKSYHNLRKIAKGGKGKASDITASVQKLDSKLHTRVKLHAAAQVDEMTTALQDAIEDELTRRKQLIKTLLELQQIARDNKERFLARKIQRLASDIDKGKADVRSVTKRMAHANKAMQRKKNAHNFSEWQDKVQSIDTLLTEADSAKNYVQLRASLGELHKLLRDTGDKGASRFLKVLDRRTGKKINRRNSLSTIQLERIDERVMQLVARSRKNNRYQERLQQWEKARKDVSAGLADSGVMHPKRDLEQGLRALQRALEKIQAEPELAELKRIQEQLTAGQASKQHIAHTLDALDDAFRHSQQATAVSRWKVKVTEVKGMLAGGSPLLKLDSSLDGIWDNMEKTLSASPLREGSVANLKKLQHYALSGDWQEKALASQLEKLDRKVKARGSFRTADELDAVQGKERRAAQRELRQRIAQLRSEQSTEVKRRATALGAALREGEKTRKAAQGRFAWFNYGDGGERVIDREQVLAALRNGQQPDAIEVRTGLEKLAAQLTGATIFVALPFVLADNEAPQSDEQQELLPLLQQVAQAVDARITPAANCLLGSCAAGD